MQQFNPPTIIAHSPTNSFTTLSQPFPTTSISQDLVDVGIWETEPDRNEQGLILDIPIFTRNANGEYIETTLNEYPIDTTAPDYYMADTNVICHWATPPYQTVGGIKNLDNPTNLDVGVVAFHASGDIDRVEFFLNGGSQRVIVKEPSHHPDQDVTAYWIRIDNSSGLQDSGDVWGTQFSSTAVTGFPNQTKITRCSFTPHHELQAVVYPKVGKPRVLAGKHNNHATTMVYNGITDYWEDSQEKIKIKGHGDSAIRSYYFSTNFNDTLFQDSVYVSADFGVDDLNRDGTENFPFFSIDFAHRKLIRMKHKFYNNLTDEPNFNFDKPNSGSNRLLAEVGGGTIFLMKHISEKNKRDGHKNGYKTLATITVGGSTEPNAPYIAFSKMRWVTIRPEPGVSKYEAMIKGYFYQPFTSFPTTRSLLQKTAIKKSFSDIKATLSRYKNCYVEASWPYSEMIFGIGPDLNLIGDDGSGTKLVELSNWIPNRGILSKNIPPGETTYAEQNHVNTFILHNEGSVSNYTYGNQQTNQAELTSGPFVAPRFWLDSCELNGQYRSTQQLYAWADSLGMTYTTTFVGPPDLEGEQRRRKAEDPIKFQNLIESEIGIFSTIDGRKIPSLELTGPNSEGLSLTTPRVFVQPTEQTLMLTNGLGFTLGFGYTFEFCFAHPEFGGCRTAIASSNAGGLIPSFVTNTFLRNIDNDPSSLAVDSFINSTLCNYNGDVFRYQSSLIYQPFIFDSIGTRNYVNHDESALFGVHSDIFQTVGGDFNFFKNRPAVNNFIFYRFNNPSPRSKRYSDPVARHGVPGVGPLTDIVFQKQWSISGRHGPISLGDKFFYDPEKYPEGDGRTYVYWNSPHVKDIIFQDCLVYTEDGSQQLQITCYHENTIYRNTQVHYAPNVNQPNGISLSNVFSFAPRVSGPTTRYKDAVPNNIGIIDASQDDYTEQSGACLNKFLLDNYQCYQTKLKVNPITGKDVRVGTYREPVKYNVVRNGGRLVNVPINGYNRPKPFGHSLFRPIFSESSPTFVISDLRYPFQRDASGNAGPNQTTGDNPRIAFPSADARHRNAFLSFMAKGNPLPQPTSNTRGEWFTYQKTIPASTTSSDAPYGWVYSDIPYENFKYGQLPHPNGTIFNDDNAAIQAVDPTFLIEKNRPDGNGGFTWGINEEDHRASLGTGWDPTFGTGKLNPQPTDPGYNPNQKGLREKVFYAFTNFDFDATRSEFGEVLTPDRLPLLSGESGGTGGTGNQQNGQPPTAILNHPITIRLSITDLTKEMSWSRKDSLDNSAGTTHGPDGIYSSSDLIQIPNYLERIEEVTDPNGSPEIGPSVNTEIIGNTFGVGNQGGVYVTGGVADFTLDTTIGKMNSIDITNISTIYLNKARKNNGLTMSLILHGKSVPGTSMAEFKYIAAPLPELDVNNQEINEGDVDLSGDHYEDFYKKFAYIAFNSRESQVTQSITSNQFSFRKSPHHTFVQFNRAEIDGLSLSNVLNGTSIMDMVTPIAASKLAKIQTAAIGCTCTFNSNTTANESTSADRINPSSSTTIPGIITCKNITMEYLGSEANGNQIRFKNKFPVSMFSGRVGTTTYQHNGAVAAFNETFQFFSSVNDYRIPAPPAPLPGEQGEPEPTINLRFINPVGSGSKNLLGYKVANGVRLFGGANNIGITAGSYIRISGSPNNNGIYQVKNMFDGIDGDTASNTVIGGLPEFQYLELSRTITAQEQSNPTSITVENVSHLPILHIKYRQPL